MVEVAHSGPVFARIHEVAKLHAFFLGLLQSFAAVVVLGNVFRRHSVRYVVVGFGWEVEPPSRCCTVVDDNVGYGLDAVGFESADEAQEFSLCAERTVVIAEPIVVVVAH